MKTILKTIEMLLAAGFVLGCFSINWVLGVLAIIGISFLANY